MMDIDFLILFQFCFNMDDPKEFAENKSLKKDIDII